MAETTLTSAELLALARRQNSLVPLVMVTLPKPEDAVAAAQRALAEIRPEVARRTTGTLVYPDAKEPCKAGAFADDIGASKSSEFDPNHCLISGGPWVRPVLERAIDCSRAGEDLVWGSLITKAQTQLRALAMAPPAKDAGWQLKLDYFEAVMELCDVVLQGTNLPPGSIPSFLAWAVGIQTPTEEVSADFSKNNLLARGSDVAQYQSINLLNTIIRSTPADQNRYGSRPFWLRGSLTGWNYSTPGFNWDTTPIFAPPRVVPSYYASGGFGWAPWISANSRYQKITQGEVLPFAQGFFGCNAGQSYQLSSMAYSKQNWGQDWVGATCVGSGCGLHRFVLPSQVLEKLVAGSTTDDGKAEQALRRAMTMSPHDILKLIFQETGTSNRRVAAWSFDRIYKLTWYGMPEPARTIDDVRAVETVGGHYYVMAAADWARFVGSLNTGALMQKAAIEYLTRAKKVVEQLALRGLPVDLKPTDIEAMIAAVQATKAAERMAIIGAMSSVFQIMGGVAGAIMQLVSTVVLGGFLEFLNSSVPPSGREDFALLLQPFALRSPSKDTPVCSFNPEADGGAQGLVTQFMPRFAGGGGNLFDIATGQNPPPPAPVALADAAAAQDQAILTLLGRETKQRKAIYIGAAVGVAAIGGAVLWKYLR